MQTLLEGSTPHHDDKNRPRLLLHPGFDDDDGGASSRWSVLLLRGEGEDRDHVLRGGCRS